MCIPVSSCCFCLSLDVGAKIISIISVMFSTLTAIIYGTPVVMPSHVDESRKIVYAVVATGAIVQVLVGCTLVYGVFRKNPRLLIPWLAYAWVSCVTLLALSVFGSALVLLNYTGDPNVGAEISGMVSVYFLEGVILYYFASVVSSRRREMLHEDSTESAERLMRRYYGAQRFVV